MSRRSRHNRSLTPLTTRRSGSTALVSLAVLICAACAPAPQTGSETPRPAATDPATPGPENFRNEPDFRRTTLPTDTIRIGVLAIDSAVSVHRRYRPLLDYLAAETGYAFDLVPLTQESQFEAVAAENLHFVFSNPLASVEIKRLYDTAFIATKTRPETGDRFSGLIVVRQDSPIQTLEDLRGKRVACVNVQTAAAGCVFQMYHVLQQGIDPFVDFEALIEIPSQDNIVLAVLNGSIDAGFVRTGQIEQTVAKGLVSSPDRLRVLEPVDDNFPYPHTTALYPEWPVSVLDHTDPAIATKVERALLNLPSEHPASAAAGLAGFVPPGDYAPLNHLIETLQLTSWDAEP